MNEREQIRQAMDALEQQRHTLGDAAVGAALAGLRKRLKSFEGSGIEEQRKQVTVLFADVEGFTSLAEGRDPEDVSAVMGAYFSRWQEAIACQGGVVEKFIGDAVMAVFGVPIAREDDPERAIMAALAMRNTLISLNEQLRQSHGVSLAMRVGITTGPVVVSAAVDGGIEGHSVFGDTVNTASRLQQMCPVGEILISQDTYRQVEDLFSAAPAGSLSLKGKEQEIPGYLVLGTREKAFWRSDRGFTNIMPPMIGRDKELQYLKHALDSTIRNGRPQAVTVVGDAGVGKSRLIKEFDTSLKLHPDAYSLFRGRAMLRTMHTPYGLIRDLLVSRFGIRESDSRRIAQEKVAHGVSSMLGHEGEYTARVALIAQLLGFGRDEASPLRQASDPREIWDRATRDVSLFITEEARRQPVIVLLEDLHWADESSLSFVERVMATARGAVFIVSTARPSLFEHRPSWGEDGDPQAIVELAPLSDEGSRQLLKGLLQEPEEAPSYLIDMIAERAEGNPLFLEELVRMLMEGGGLRRSDAGWDTMVQCKDLERVPTTLIGILQARVDALTPLERRILQCAAVIGRVFWSDAISFLVSPRDDGSCASLEQAIGSLCGRLLVFEQHPSSFSETSQYIFKHALLHDVAYESVLKRERPGYHARAAEWLAARCGDREEEYAAIVAEHLLLAGRTEEAIDRFVAAGRSAIARFANAEAVVFFCRALDILSPNDPARRFEILLARERARNLLGARDAQLSDLVEMETVATALSDDRMLAVTANRRADYSQATGDYAGGVAAARVALEHARTAGDPLEQADGLLHWGRCLMLLARYDEAEEHMRDALDAVERNMSGWVSRENGIPGQVPSVSQDKAEDAKARILMSLGLLAWDRGRAGESIDLSTRALAIARRRADGRMEGGLLSNIALSARAQGDSSSANDLLVQALETFREIGDRRGEGGALLNVGMCALDNGSYDQAEAWLEEALRIKRELRERHGEANALKMLGGVAFQRGDFTSAKDRFECSLTISREIGHRQGEAAAVSNLMVVNQAIGDLGAALACARNAVELYRHMGDDRGVGIALTNLGDLTITCGRYEEGGAFLEEALTLGRTSGFRRNVPSIYRSLARAAMNTADLDQAEQLSRRALQAAESIELPVERILALQELGHAKLAMGRLEEAAATFGQALEGASTPDLESQCVGIRAGLAVTLCSLGDFPGALSHAEMALSQLASKSVPGETDVLSIRFECCKVLNTVGDPRAKGLLEQAVGLVRARANTLSGTDLERSYLEKVPLHRELLREWERVSGSPG
ncbi:tetratricopeptide repeat protein [Candidatus Fermentibacteria bacterium]|nr:tetratricopeptide repeat protein [Candidatus Fermentibacteria bacterium]